MKEHILEYVKEHCIGSRGAALLIGPTAEKELRELYPQFDPEGNNYLLEITENETQFWNNFLGAVGGNDWKDRGFERHTACDYTEMHLRKKKRSQHLFLPNVDEMFYKYDILGKGMMNAGLRRLWSSDRLDLTIIGSVKDFNSESYKRTFCEYTFPFYIGNWCAIEIE